MMHGAYKLPKSKSWRVDLSQQNSPDFIHPLIDDANNWFEKPAA
jgi:hypothetical protein